MTETTEAVSTTDSQKTVQQCMEFVRRHGGRACQVQPNLQQNLRATPRMFFSCRLSYSTDSTLSGKHTKPAQMIDIGLGGVGFWCFEPLREGMAVHICLPVLAGQTAWVQAKVVYCRPEGEHYRAGIAFILD